MGYHRPYSIVEHAEFHTVQSVGSKRSSLKWFIVHLLVYVTLFDACVAGRSVSSNVAAAAGSNGQDWLAANREVLDILTRLRRRHQEEHDGSVLADIVDQRLLQQQQQSPPLVNNGAAAAADDENEDALYDDVTADELPGLYTRLLGIVTQEWLDDASRPSVVDKRGKRLRKYRAVSSLNNYD